MGRYEGRQARIQIVDNFDRGWGNIGVDQIVFTDVPPTTTPIREQPDFGTMALVLVGRPDKAAADRDAESPSEEAAAPFDRRLIGTLGRSVRLGPGQWRLRNWRIAGALSRQLRRVAPPRLAFVANSPFWVVAAKQAWPGVPVVFRFPCLLSNCLPFTWPQRRPPTFWARVNFVAARRVEHQALMMADQTLVATPENRAEVLAFQPAARARVSQCYFGCRPLEITEPLRQQHRRELGVDEDAFVVTAAGVADLNKAFDWALREMPAVDRRARLLIVGDGPELERLKRLARRLSLTDRVHLVGAPPDIAPWYAAADCVICTSFYDAYPNVIREGMQCGRTVIVPRHDPPKVYAGIADTIRREGGGLLYDRHTTGALAECINHLVHDREETARLGRRAHAVAGRLFDWNACVDHLLAYRVSAPPARTCQSCAR